MDFTKWSINLISVLAVLQLLRIETSAAGLAVRFVSANADLLTGFQAFPIRIHSNVHRRFFTAGADVFDFFDVIGECEKKGRTWKRFTTKIAA